MTIETKKKLEVALAKLAKSTDPRVRRLLESMAERHPDLFPVQVEPSDARPQQLLRVERQA